MRNLISILNFLANITFATLFWGCGQERLGPVAGGEILNPPGKQTLAGIIMNADARPAIGAEVRAFPLTYNPVADSGAILSGWTDTTILDGSFSLSGLDTNRVNLWVVDRRHGTLMLIRSVKPGSEGNAAAGHMLKPPGALAISFPEVALKAESYVYMEGTPVFRWLGHLVGTISPKIILDSIPEGQCPPIKLVVTRAPENLKIIGTDFRVHSLDTVNLAVFPEWHDYTRIFLRHEGLAAGLTKGLYWYAWILRIFLSVMPKPMVLICALRLRMEIPFLMK
jgi:hypothetical protein